MKIRRKPSLNCSTCGSRKQAINYPDHRDRPKSVLLCPVCDLRPCPQKRFVMKEST